MDTIEVYCPVTKAQGIDHSAKYTHFHIHTSLKMERLRDKRTLERKKSHWSRTSILHLWSMSLLLLGANVIKVMIIIYNFVTIIWFVNAQSYWGNEQNVEFACWNLLHPCTCLTDGKKGKCNFSAAVSPEDGVCGSGVCRAVSSLRFDSPALWLPQWL